MSHPCVRCSRPAELFLCWTCAKALRRTINQLPWLTEQLATAAHGGSALNRLDERQFFERRPLTEDEEQSPVPFNDTARRRLDELDATLVRWVLDLCDSAGIQFVPLDGRTDTPTDPARRAPVLAGWLSHHFMAIAASEDAALCADEIHQCFERGVEAINRRDQGIYVGPCPTTVGVEPDGKTPVRCREALYAKRGEDGSPKPHVTCWKCRQRHDTERLRERAWAQASNFLMTGSEILRVMDELGEHLPKNRFYTWRKSRAIRPRGWKSADGRITDHAAPGSHPVFALAEVRELAAREGVTA